MKLRIAENFRAVFYAPFYALAELGLAEQEGLRITLVAGESPGSAIEGVKRGDIDLTWGGPMRVIKDHDEQPDDGASLVCFGEVVARDPFFLLARPGLHGFRLSDLARLRLGVVTEVPTPWLCLQADLRDAGIDLSASLGIASGLSMAQQLQALRAGDLDVIQVFEPYVSQALAEGVAEVVYAAHERGPTSYTTFIGTKAGLARHGEAPLAALMRGLGRLKAWIETHGPDALAAATASYFPDVDPALYAASIARYHRAGIWACEPEVSAAGFDRLAYSLHAGGFVSRRMPYEACCVRPWDEAPTAAG